MPRECSHLRLVRPPALRVVDVALFYGERSGGIRTYLDAKRRVLADDPRADHHVIVPGARERHGYGWHELPSLRLAAANGYRVPVGVRHLKQTLRDLRPDVVLLHDPFWSILGVTAVAREAGACVVAVHHTSPDLDAAGLPGPDRLWRPVMRRWFHRAYRRVDAVMSAGDTRADTGRTAALALRFGVDPAFRPQPAVRRERHVLYAGRIAREKGLDTLLDAAASGARVVASATAPAVRSVGELAHTFAPGDVAGLARAIATARAAERDLPAAAALAARSCWTEAVGREVDDLRELLAGGGRALQLTRGGTRAA